MARFVEVSRSDGDTWTPALINPENVTVVYPTLRPTEVVVRYVDGRSDTLELSWEAAIWAFGGGNL